ncbi:5'-methylthioadenosine/S-adenosylhomocysteine nucleosidase [Oceanobacillus arenosus]|uniref:5'-methylthioadenosine/S-adenosylhomocysteine nucleosidase n=1 Tax=Oceanobacillus arenosus TaxID=1229153 RepID=A0A3D8PWJ6_9BACI|nr:5'-methylthioadenosine/S-adenosylhomocysteine nucleosidase [Oceanobacillus arenosus]RDW19265.1 5'-methylthioadenosine/S-adenosylhomocysteine nucleosidase [Oceanobacillus arenosus]
MKIGIIGAMDEEVALLLDNMTGKQEVRVANCLFVEGKLQGKDVVLLKSGIGKVNAAMATTIMHERFAPSHVINTGSAGGFSEKLNVGDIVISTKVVHHDVDVTAFDYAYGQVPGLPDMYEADPALVEKAIAAVKDLAINYEEGIIATGDSFMEDPERVAFVRAKFPQMIASEMEAAAVAQVCYQYGKPFVIIRALSDIAGKASSISFDTFLDQAAKHAAQLIMAIIEEI